MEYITTKQQCRQQIDKLQNVCTRCGGKLEPIETVDNANNPTFWIGCNGCSRFDNGTKPNIYKIAVRMVDESNFTAYNYEQQPDKEKQTEQFDYWRKGQISGTVGVVFDILRFEKQMQSKE
jgi:hypothetical protein